MRTFYIYSLKVGNQCIVEAYTEEQTSEFERKLLFTVPEQWLPNNKEQFLKACAYFKVQVPADVQWFGYVPF